MKRLLLVGAAALALTSLLVVEASAQRGGRGGGVYMGGGGRAVAIGGGFRGPSVGRGFVGGRYIARGGYVARGWRPGWRVGFPVVAGIAAVGAYGYGGYYGYPYYDSCMRWNGWRWVNICYAPYPFAW
jgi:hypothetical protein